MDGGEVGNSRRIHSFILGSKNLYRLKLSLIIRGMKELDPGCHWVDLNALPSFAHRNLAQILHLLSIQSEYRKV